MKSIGVEGGWRELTDVERVLQTCMVGIDDSDADWLEKRECRQQDQRDLEVLLGGLASGDRERLSGLAPEFSRLEAPAALPRSRAQQRCRSRAALPAAGVVRPATPLTM